MRLGPSIHFRHCCTGIGRKLCALAVTCAGVQGRQKPDHAGDGRGGAGSRCVHSIDPHCYKQLASMPRAALSLATRARLPTSARFALAHSRAVWLAPPPVRRRSVAPCRRAAAAGPALACHPARAARRRGRQSQPLLWRAAAQLTACCTATPRQLSPGLPHGGSGMRACRASAGACLQAADSSPWC